MMEAGLRRGDRGPIPGSPEGASHGHVRREQRPFRLGLRGVGMEKMQRTAIVFGQIPPALAQAGCSWMGKSDPREYRTQGHPVTWIRFSPKALMLPSSSGTSRAPRACSI